MVLSYKNLDEVYSSSPYGTHAYNSFNDITEIVGTPPKYSCPDSRCRRPVFVLDKYESEDESEDESVDMVNLFDLPMEIFLSSIIPQMSLEDMQAFHATSTHCKALVEMSQDWDSRYMADFADSVPLSGSGFTRYCRRAAASCEVSGIAAKGAPLKHIALSDYDQDIVRMRVNHHNNKTWMSPFIPLNKLSPIRSVAANDLLLTGEKKIAQIGSTSVHNLDSDLNKDIVQLDRSLARSTDGSLFRIMFDEFNDSRVLTLIRIDIPHFIYNFTCIKNRVYALASDVGLISWLTSEEEVKDNSISVEYTKLLDEKNTSFKSMAVYEHTYGSSAEVALLTDSEVYTLLYDRTSSKASVCQSLTDCKSVKCEGKKVVYYEEGTFLVVTQNSYVQRLKGSVLFPVASLKDIADIVVSKKGFCLALNNDGQVYAWDCRTRREVSTWAIGSIVKGTRVPIANPQLAKLDGTCVSISCTDEFAFALVA